MELNSIQSKGNSPLQETLNQIRGNGITTDDYRCDNYEMACSYAKAIDLTIKDKERNKTNYYEVEICPHKSPHIDAYIICTTEKHKNYGLQIKSGNHYDNFIKERIYHAGYRYALEPDEYLLITWNELHTQNRYNAQIKVSDEDIKGIIHNIESKKDKYPKEYDFLSLCFEILKENTCQHNSANWIRLNRLQSLMLNKNQIENVIL